MHLDIFSGGGIAAALVMALNIGRLMRRDHLDYKLRLAVLDANSSAPVLDNLTETRSAERPAGARWRATG